MYIFPGMVQSPCCLIHYLRLDVLAGLNVEVDVVSLGELHVAQNAGFPADAIHLHGNNKSELELRSAIQSGIRAVVGDSLDELNFLETLAAEQKQPARIWLRITPDLEVDTHPHVSTANVRSKFGLHIVNGEADQGIRQAAASPWINLNGLHTHLGSQLQDASVYRQAIRQVFNVAKACQFIQKEFSPGGGWGVRYTESDLSDNPEPWIQTVSRAVQEKCAEFGWPLPRLVIEPGRWLAARAGVAIYSVGTQKTTADGIHLAAVDGGMADNPRVALYDARYTARVAQRTYAAATEHSQIVGKFYESGDVLISDILLPPMERGDLLAVPAAGAYQLSMASNYNLAPRPAVVWLEEGAAEVLQCCEQPDQQGWYASPG